jgi:hypothetical protein
VMKEELEITTVRRCRDCGRLMKIVKRKDNLRYWECEFCREDGDE